MSPPIEPLKARIRVIGSVKVIDRILLSDDQKKELDRTPYGILAVDVDPSIPLPLRSIPETKDVCVETEPDVRDVSTQTNVKELESKDEKDQRSIDEQDLKLGRAIRALTFDENLEDLDDKKDKTVQMIISTVTKLSSIKHQLGHLSNGTIFANTRKLASQLLGVCQRTVQRKVAIGRNEIQSLEPPTKKQKKKILEIISPEMRQKILDHIQECYAKDDNFTLVSLLAALKAKYDFEFKRTTLYNILKAMDIAYKIKTYNPMASGRGDLIEWRARYLKMISDLREQGAYICYYDETWIYHGMTKRKGWVMKYKNAYEIARMGSLKNPLPGFKAASDKGIRANVLAVLTESGILAESIDVMTSKRPADEQLVDYHKNMDSAAYKQYMEKVLPALAKATPAGRKAVLVIDNASTHCEQILQLPTKYSSKTFLKEFLESQNIAVDPELLQKDLWGEAERFMEAHGGRVVMKKFVVDEYAKHLGVTIVRLPPYHCCLNPIELIWGQLKAHLRDNGNTENKIEIVRRQAINFLKDVNETHVANTIAHTIEVEQDLRTIMEAEMEEEMEKERENTEDMDIDMI